MALSKLSKVFFKSFMAKKQCRFHSSWSELAEPFDWRDYSDVLSRTRDQGHCDVKHLFESICGEVQRLRLLGDYQHSTRIAFVEFTVAESAIAALSCSGVILGAQG